MDPCISFLLLLAPHCHPSQARLVNNHPGRDSALLPFPSAHCPAGWVSNNIPPSPSKCTHDRHGAAAGKKAAAVQAMGPRASPLHFLSHHFLVCEMTRLRQEAPGFLSSTNMLGFYAEFSATSSLCFMWLLFCTGADH